jgi:hypothetical protein
VDNSLLRRFDCNRAVTVQKLRKHVYKTYRVVQLEKLTLSKQHTPTVYIATDNFSRRLRSCTSKCTIALFTIGLRNMNEIELI